MNLTIPTKALRDAAGAIPSRRTGSHDPRIMLLQKEQRLIVFGGTHPEVEVQLTCDSDGGNSHVTLPLEKFSSFLSVAPSDITELSVEDTALVIKSGQAILRLQIIDTPWELYHWSADECDFEVSRDEFLTALEAVKHAVAFAEYQAAFKGIHIEQQGGGINVVASDGFRLARYSVELEGKPELDRKLLLHAGELSEFVKQAKSRDAERVQIKDMGPHVQFTVGNCRIKVGTLDMEFPDYQRVIPNDFARVSTIPASTLIEALNRVSIMSDKTANSRVDMTLENNELRLMAQGSYGEAHETLELDEDSDPKKFELAYNAKYLADALRPVAGSTISLNLSGCTSPSTIHTTEPDAPYLAMVVPLRDLR